MKKQIVLMIIIIKFLSTSTIVRTDEKNARKIDPLKDFRYPLSLVEMVHEKLNNMYCSLDGELKRSSDSFNIDILVQDFVNLSTLYDDMVGTSSQHMVRSDDKEFLEKMIERIDQLIAQLEGTGKKSKNYQQLRDLCSEFKQRIFS